MYVCMYVCMYVVVALAVDSLAVEQWTLWQWMDGARVKYLVFCLLYCTMYLKVVF